MEYQMAQEISMAVVVNPNGATATERRNDVVRSSAASVRAALSGHKGTLGKTAREGIVFDGEQRIAFQCAKGNYRPFAEYLAAVIAEPVVVSNRGAFEAMGDWAESRILKVKMSKSGGYRTNKDGVSVPNASLKTALELKAFIVDVLSAVAEYHAATEEERIALTAE